MAEPLATELPVTEPLASEPQAIHADHLTRNREACRAYYHSDPKRAQQAKKRAVMSQIGTKGRVCSATTLRSLNIDVHELIIQARRYLKANPDAPERKVTDLRVLVANML